MSNSGTNYDQWLASIARRVALLGSTPLFIADVDKHALWKAYLDGFTPERRQHHNCNACQHFINRYGALVTADSRSVIWELDHMPEEYRQSVVNMLAVLGSRIRGVFRSGQRVLGTHSNLDKFDRTWTHFSCELHSDCPSLKWNNQATRSAGQAMAADRENHKALTLALRDFDVALVNKAVELLSSDAAYRGADVLGPAKFLQDLHNTDQHQRSDAIWLALATAPEGFCHPRRSMVGTVLEDLKAGLSAEVVLRKFADKMAPSRYQRPTAAPTVGAIKQAEKTVEQLGLARSLERRFARLDEVLPRAIWLPAKDDVPATLPTGSVFGHLVPKGTQETVKDLEIPTVTMTWAKFCRTILPNVASLEAKSSRRVALITAVHEDAAPIIAWDSTEERNPFSWSYVDGADAEIRRRVLAAGGKHEGCDIRVSLIWNNRNDLDLHCVTPLGSHIYFGSKQHDNGWLDVDMNVNGETTEPVENIRFELAHAGRYRFYVENYAHHQESHLPTPFTVEVAIGGIVSRFSHTMPGSITDAKSRVEVASFVWTRNVGSHGIESACKREETAVANGFAKVRAIVASPNTWANGYVKGTSHTFLLLEGAKATDIGAPHGLLPEMLRPELRELRSVLAAYAGSATIAESGGDDAAGIGLNDDTEWDLTLRAHMKSGSVANYVIDRFE